MTNIYCIFKYIFVFLIINLKFQLPEYWLILQMESEIMCLDGERIEREE
ncbi:hypothetical protein HMPREF0083_00465 [Aneurinibacillus aneurinilyticus ATCC 12856]|uniref:Uncharacterized protein n=1 Tax=Aneurinibacillus aneurinilyticus ATCC 12856 TaxID=649747 RepID=U1XA98_ANEAE|nr:hypothetical protein HMPREF0083_00465 [Aneurinibacillus aneurinilyticus ATCC 12856]